jgi:RNA polymerase sigma factor (sigma-70 family)
MDAAHLGRLVNDIAPALLAMAHGRGLDAEDIVQQAFLALLKASVPPSNVPAWLFGTVRKLALMQVRANGRRERREKGAARHEVCLPRDPDRSLDLEMVMAELDADDRDMVLARVHGGLSCEEIGTMMGFSATTAWRRLDAAMAAIRLRLEGEI